MPSSASGLCSSTTSSPAANRWEPGPLGSGSVTSPPWSTAIVALPQVAGCGSGVPGGVSPQGSSTTAVTVPPTRSNPACPGAAAGRPSGQSSTSAASVAAASGSSTASVATTARREAGTAVPCPWPCAWFAPIPGSGLLVRRRVRQYCTWTGRVGDAHGDPGGDLRVAVRGLARRPLPGGGAAAALAGDVRGDVPHRREQQRVLPAAQARDVRRLARADPRQLRHGRQGQPLPHPHQTARRAGGAGGQADGGGGGARGHARPDPAAAPAHAPGRPRQAGTLPELLPRPRPARRGVPARLLVDR